MYSHQRGVVALIRIRTKKTANFVKIWGISLYLSVNKLQNQLREVLGQKDTLRNSPYY